MSSVIYTFLNSEITCIPGAIRKVAGEYYNNTLCNGATWLFLLWSIFHFIYDRCMQVFLRRLKYKNHISTRLADGLWYLGFFSTALMYCGATLARNEVELFNFKKMHVPSDIHLPNQIILGFILICTFYMHTSLWNGFKAGYFLSCVKYLFLTMLCLCSYILRVLEISFTLTALISISEVVTETTRIFYIVSWRDNFYSNIFVGAFFILTLLIYTAVHIVIIPLTFAIPLGLKILSDYPNLLLIFLFSSLLCWFTLNIFKSILFNFLDHWLYHNREAQDVFCPGAVIECSLFLPRDDEAYYLHILRNEMKNRETELISKRKPKNRGMLLQTLKCMVAIKRKLGEKRLSETSDSDESEKSDGEKDMKHDESSGIILDNSNVETKSTDEFSNKDSFEYSEENKIFEGDNEPQLKNIVGGLKGIDGDSNKINK